MGPERLELPKHAQCSPTRQKLRTRIQRAAPALVIGVSVQLAIDGTGRFDYEYCTVSNEKDLARAAVSQTIMIITMMPTRDFQVCEGY